jgi:MFS family permease
MLLQGLRPAVLIGGFIKKLDNQSFKDLPPPLVRGLKAYRRDGAFASLSDNLAINFFEVYMISLGGGNRDVGLMASIANLLGFLSLAPGVMAARFLGHRKPIVLLFGGGLGRLMYLALALIPFIFSQPAMAIPAMILFNGIRVFMGNFSNPAWTSMTASLVPEQVRGSYFASRNAAIAITGSIATLSAGWIVLEGNRSSVHHLFGYSLLFIAAFIFGMISTWNFSQVPDIKADTKKTSPTEPGKQELGGFFRGLLHYPLFIAFLSFSFVWNFALQVSGPFFNVYLVRELGASSAMVGMVATSGNIVQIFALPFWGGMVYKRGDLWVLVVTGLCIPVLPILWVFTHASWQPLLINLLTGFLWAGFNLANFNFLLKMIPESDRQEGAALYQALVLLSTVLGPLVGAEVVVHWGYRWVFALSGILRYGAFFVFYLLGLRKIHGISGPRDTSGTADQAYP